MRLALKLKMIQKHSGTIHQEATVGRSAVHGEPAVRRQDGAGEYLHAARRKGRYLEGHPLSCHEGQLHIHYS